MIIYVKIVDALVIVIMTSIRRGEDHQVLPAENVIVPHVNAVTKMRRWLNWKLS